MTERILPRLLLEPAIGFSGPPWRLPSAVLASWIGRRRQRLALAELDARLLDDVGLSEGEVRREAAKPFWKL